MAMYAMPRQGALEIVVRRFWCWLFHTFTNSGRHYEQFTVAGNRCGHFVERFLGCCLCKTGEFAEKKEADDAAKA